MPQKNNPKKAKKSTHLADGRPTADHKKEKGINQKRKKGQHFPLKAEKNKKY